MRRRTAELTRAAFWTSLKADVESLASNDLLAAPASEGKAVRLRSPLKEREASLPSISNKPQLDFLQKAANNSLDASGAGSDFVIALSVKLGVA